MNNLRALLDSSIGRKAIVALTGLGLFVFVIGHLLGNLLIFAGRDALNGYAHALKSNMVLLWIGRSGVIACFVLHIWASFTLNQRSQDARPVRYAKQRILRATPASRSMVLTGLVVLTFLIYHLLHFTIGVTNPSDFAMEARLPSGLASHDVFGMVVAGFSQPAIAIAYVCAMVVLGLHLSHGIASTVQSIGLNHPVYTPIVQRAGIGVAILLALANCTIPLSVLAGWIGGGQ